MISGFTQNMLPEIIKVDSVITIHYFEYTKDFYFTGEAHDFWELVYVDNGSVVTKTDDNTLILNKKEITLHRPNVYHSIWANNSYANVMILTFVCHSQLMDFFTERAYRAGENVVQSLSNVLALHGKIFKGPLNIVDQKEMLQRENASPLHLQLLKIEIEQLLLNLILSQTTNREEPKHVKLHDHSEADLASVIISYMMEHFHENITLQTIAAETCFSVSYIKKKFKEQTGMTIIECLTKIRVDHAKHLISQRKNTFSEIAEMTGFNTIHYFSKVFKGYTSMTPSEYAESVKAQSLL